MFAKVFRDCVVSVPLDKKSRREVTRKYTLKLLVCL